MSRLKASWASVTHDFRWSFQSISKLVLLSFELCFHIRIVVSSSLVHFSTSRMSANLKSVSGLSLASAPLRIL